MSAIVTPTKSTAKPVYLVAAVFVAVLVVIALAISAWARSDAGGSTTPTRGNVISTEPSVQSVNALSPERPDSAIADWARGEGLTGLSAASLHQSVNVSPTPPHADAIARSEAAAECRLTGPC